MGGSAFAACWACHKRRHNHSCCCAELQATPGTVESIGGVAASADCCRLVACDSRPVPAAEVVVLRGTFDDAGCAAPAPGCAGCECRAQRRVDSKLSSVCCRCRTISCIERSLVSSFLTICTTLPAVICCTRFKLSSPHTATLLPSVALESATKPRLAAQDSVFESPRSTITLEKAWPLPHVHPCALWHVKQNAVFNGNATRVPEDALLPGAASVPERSSGKIGTTHGSFGSSAGPV